MDLAEFKFYKKHNKNYFYKYTSAETGKLILSGGKFRHSSPLIFNDPFDCQAGLQLKFDRENFVNNFFNRVEELVTANEEPLFIDLNRYAQVTLFMREKYKDVGFPKDKILKNMGPIIQTLADGIYQTEEAMKNNWIDTATRMRVFCISELFDNILMWSHYADFHRGIVIELKVAETVAEDDPLWIAQPVRYVNDTTPLFSNNVIDEILGIEESKFRSAFEIYAYVKYNVWEYEKEWRYFDIVDNLSESPYKDISFNFNKISSIYFGCNCTDKDMNEIVSIVRSKKDNVHFFKAVKHPCQYKLEFKKLSIN